MHARADASLAEPPDGLKLEPASRHVDRSKRREMKACQALTAVEDEVSLKGTRSDAAPFAPGPYGHLCLEALLRYRLGFRLKVAEPDALLLQEAVDCRSAHAKQQLSN